MQICERDNHRLMKKKYLDIIRKKTASLFAASCHIGAVIADVPNQKELVMSNYGLNFGMAFQIIDDLIDLVGEANSLGKVPRQDLSVGELTLPILHRTISRSPCAASTTLRNSSSKTARTRSTKRGSESSESLQTSPSAWRCCSTRCCITPELAEVNWNSTRRTLESWSVRVWSLFGRESTTPTQRSKSILQCPRSGAMQFAAPR